MRHFIAVVIFSALWGMSPARGFAQGDIEGRVIDRDSREEIAHATVYLAGTRFGTHTEEDGRFTLSDIPPGQYELRASIVGYREKGLQIAVVEGELLKVDIALESVPFQEEEMIITATRWERKISEVPASVVVVEDEIAETKMFNIKEALAGTPGVLIDTKNQGYDSRLIIRGAGLKARYGVRDIMVLLDGVPITDPDGFTRLDFIDTQLIKRVEVVKGPNSTLWGANAAGGVINMIAKSPFERKGGTIKIGGGEFGTGSAHLSYSGRAGSRLFYTVSGSRRQSDNGWRDWNEFWTNQLSLQTSWLSGDDTVLQNNFSYTKASLQIPGKLDEEQFAVYGRSGEAPETFEAWRSSGRYSEIFFFSSKLTKKWRDFEFTPVVYVNQWNHHHPITGRVNDADTYTYGTDLQVNNIHAVKGMKGTLSTGVALRFDDQETDYFEYADCAISSSGRILSVLSDDAGDLIEKQDREVFLAGVYAQESLWLTNRWIVDAGIRIDRVDIDISGTKWGEYSWGAGTYVECPDPGVDNCGNYLIKKNYNALSPRLGVNYHLTDVVNLFGNISTGIQTPTESEVSDNPELELVEVRSYELGLKARHVSWKVDASVYYSPVKNEVTSRMGEGGVSEYFNAGKTDKKGFEFAGTYFIDRSLSFGANYAYSDYSFAEFSEPVREGRTQVDVDRSGNQLPYIPQHQSSFFAMYRHPRGLKLRVQALNWGSYYVDNANTEKYEGYSWLTNAMVGYEINGLDIGLNVDNLTDKQYAVEVDKDSGGVRRYVPAMPRSFITRLTYHF